LGETPQLPTRWVTCHQADPDVVFEAGGATDGLPAAFFNRPAENCQNLSGSVLIDWFGLRVSENPFGFHFLLPLDAIEKASAIRFFIS